MLFQKVLFIPGGAQGLDRASWDMERLPWVVGSLSVCFQGLPCWMGPRNVVSLMPTSPPMAVEIKDIEL